MRNLPLAGTHCLAHTAVCPHMGPVTVPVRLTDSHSLLQTLPSLTALPGLLHTPSSLPRSHGHVGVPHRAFLHPTHCPPMRIASHSRGSTINRPTCCARLLCGPLQTACTLAHVHQGVCWDCASLLMARWLNLRVALDTACPAFTSHCHG